MNGEQRVAVITGSAGGIGAEIGKQFLDTGSRVAAVDIDEQKLSATWDGIGLALAADVTDGEALGRAADAVAKEYGHVNALIVNAGNVMERLEGFEALSDEQWERTIDVNLTGAYKTIRAFLPLLKKAPGHKSIVVTSSVLGMRGSGSMVAYSSAKAGLLGLTTSLAQGLGQHGVTVNAVAPCLVQSEKFVKLAGAGLPDLLARIPLGRLGETSDIANAVSFLASEKASFITGQVLTVDGGVISTAWWHPYWK